MQRDRLWGMTLVLPLKEWGCPELQGEGEKSGSEDSPRESSSILLLPWPSPQVDRALQFMKGFQFPAAFLFTYVTIVWTV
jgi:hypothetical protein